MLVLTAAPQHEAGVRAAFVAGKDVYSEWPLTPSAGMSAELMDLADKASVRHLVGLQRRMAPDYRYMSVLLAQDYVGTMRSMRMHISVEYCRQLRTAGLYYSSLLHIYGGHFLDVLFTHIGFPLTLNGLTANQFTEVTLIETGVTLPHIVPDQVVAVLVQTGQRLHTVWFAGKQKLLAVAVRYSALLMEEKSSTVMESVPLSPGTEERSISEKI